MLINPNLSSGRAVPLTTLRRLAAVAGVLLAAAAVLVPGTAAGASSAGASLSVSGDVQLLGVGVFHVETSSNQTGDGSAARGSFAGNGEIVLPQQTVQLPISLAGPVTCLSVQGDAAAFLYPVERASPPALDGLVAGSTSVLFTVRRGTDGAPDRVGFVGPLPSGLFNGCAPTGTPFEFQGTVSITPGA